MGQVNLPASADQLLRDLAARVTALEAAAQTRAPLNVITGGTLTVQDAAGNDYVYIGRLQPNLPDGSPQYGVAVYRQVGDEQVGALALSLLTGSGTPPQTIGLYDAAGNNVLTDDGLSGQGLGRPYLELGLAPSNTAVWLTTTSGSFTSQYFGAPFHQHPKVKAWGRAVLPTGVTAQLKLQSNGVDLAGSVVTITGSTGISQIWSIGPVAWSGTHCAQTDLQLLAAITGGSGTLQLQLTNCVGVQS